MKVEIPEEIVNYPRRFLVCIEYAEHNFSCNEELAKSTEFLKIPNCSFLDVCETREPIAEVIKIFKKALRR